MKCSALICLLSLPALITSCSQRAYYQSPFHTNTSDYKTIPLVRSGVGTHALYASGAFSTGMANDEWNDKQIAFFGSVYRSHTFRYIQGYYGITYGVGRYRVGRYAEADSLFDPRLSSAVDAKAINERAGNKFFGGVGAIGGINLVIPLKPLEWRIVGFEASWINEFGHYMRFRRQLPENAANLINRRRNYLTFGATSDMVFYGRHGSGGYKAGVYWFPQTITAHPEEENVKPRWFSQTVHITRHKVTGYMQWNFGFAAASFQLGASYRIQ